MLEKPIPEPKSPQPYHGTYPPTRTILIAPIGANDTSASLLLANREYEISRDRLSLPLAGRLGRGHSTVKAAPGKLKLGSTDSLAANLWI
jgi:hypothetical protein